MNKPSTILLLIVVGFLMPYNLSSEEQSPSTEPSSPATTSSPAAPTLPLNASDDQLFAEAYQEKLDIPLPMAYLRIGIKYLNYFNAEAWPTGLFGLEWGGRNFNNSALDLFKIKLYYGIGGMRFVDSPGRKDYASDFDANLEQFSGLYLKANFDLGQDFALYSFFEGNYATHHDNSNWQATLGLRYFAVDNPNLPDDGYMAYTEVHANFVRNQFSPILGLGGAWYIPAGPNGDALSLSFDAKVNLGKNRGDGSIYLDTSVLKYWYPLLIDQKTGTVDIADAALIVNVAYRFGIFRVNDILDGGKTDKQYANGYRFYLEPFLFGGVLSVPDTGAVPAFGLGINGMIADILGPFSGRPIQGSISVNLAGLDQPGYFDLSISF